MSNVTISESIKYIGADDTTLDLFESQYIIPNGISYNSYVILDEKVAVMDTIDARKSEEWFNNLSNVLAGRNVDYIVISHLEPDHAAYLSIASCNNCFPASFYHKCNCTCRHMYFTYKLILPIMTFRYEHTHKRN